MPDKPTADDEQYLPLSRLGKRYGVSKWTLLGLIKSGKLAAYKITDTRQAHLRVKVTDFEALLVRAHPDAPSIGPKTQPTRPSGAEGPKQAG